MQGEEIQRLCATSLGVSSSWYKEKPSQYVHSSRVDPGVGLLPPSIETKSYHDKILLWCHLGIFEPWCFGWRQNSAFWLQRENRFIFDSIGVRGHHNSGAVSIEGMRCVGRLSYYFLFMLHNDVTRLHNLDCLHLTISFLERLTWKCRRVNLNTNTLY
jgi:hypothetical protein